MNIAIIGGGFAGLTAARDCLMAEHNVTVYEAQPQVGGLASGFKRPGWDWSLERFYHHIFTTDHDIINLAEAIGVRDLLFFNKQVTSFFCAEHGGHAVSPLGILTNPHLPFVDRVRLGFSGVQFKLRNDWQRLEQKTAQQVLTAWAGPTAYRAYWEPLLVGKFGPHAGEVNAAWIWARVKTRSTKLGYFRGGFQAFADALARYVSEQLGGIVHTNTPVERLEQINGQWHVTAQGTTEQYDRVIVASAPGVLLKLAPQLPASYTQNMTRLGSMGAIVMVAALSESLLRNGEYWFMPPKGKYPYINVVEHTNMIPRQHYGGEHLIYLGDYLPTDHPYFTMPDDELVQEWIAPLSGINPAFRPEWIKQSWVFRERYAQPIVPVGHSQHVPSLETPLPGLFFASLSHVYPWDRGTNFAVELGHRVARVALQTS